MAVDSASSRDERPDPGHEAPRHAHDGLARRNRSLILRHGLFLRNHWYVAAWSDEIGRRPLARVVLGDYLVLFRREDGRAVALENRCPHRNLPLSEGRLVGDALECGYHGMVFDCSGACTHLPGEAVPPGDEVTLGRAFAGRRSADD